MSTNSNPAGSDRGIVPLRKDVAAYASLSPAEVLIIGSGFAGFYAARHLSKILSAKAANITVVSATDHLTYSPLLPEVAAGRLMPHRIAVPLHGALGRARIVQGLVDDIDFTGHTAHVRSDDESGFALPWDRLILATGSVTRLLPTPGLREVGFGLKTLVEGQYIHDHVLRQLELADTTSDPDERRARLTFIAVGAGYAGTETAAQLQHLTVKQISRFPRLSAGDLTWMLVDLSDSVLPELGHRLGKYTLRVLGKRGLQVRLGTTVTQMAPDGVVLSDGSYIATRTVLWTVGVTPPPLVQQLGLPVERGRVVVDDYLQLRQDVWAAGDSAAAENPYDIERHSYPPTAQHALRQGKVLAVNVAASLGYGSHRPYRHHDLGLVADLGGRKAVARPLGIPLTGLPAKVVTKGYHLLAIPSMGTKLRIAADWIVNMISLPPATQLGLVGATAAQLPVAENSDPAHSAR
jgi:NADH dehydrogenase